MSNESESKMLERVGVATDKNLGDDVSSDLANDALPNGRGTAPKQRFGFDARRDLTQLARAPRQFLVLFDQSRDECRRIFLPSAEQLGHFARSAIRFAIFIQYANAGHELNSRQAFRTFPASHGDHADFAG